METIYLEPDEEITSALDKIRQAGSQSVLVAIPKGSLLLQSVVNLELLRRQVEILSKNISVVTDDDMGARLAKRVGLNVQKKHIDVPEREVTSADIIGASVEEEVKVKTDSPAEAFSEPPKPNKRVSLSDIVSQAKVQSRSVNITGKGKRNSRPRKSLYFGSYSVDPTKIGPQKMEKNMHLSKKYPKKKESRVTSRMAKAMMGFLALVILVVALVALLILPKATLSLSLRTEQVRQNFEMVAVTSPDNNETILDSLPANLVKVLKEEKRIFKATGKKNVGAKAIGEVTLYNQRGVGQRLVATTRLQSSDKQIFRLDKEVVIPAATVGAGGEVVPGELITTVTADQSGPVGNISAGDFKIASFVEQSSELAEMVYARSKVAFNGGLDKDTVFVDQLDYDKGLEEIKQSLQGMASEEVKSGLKEGEVLLDDGLQVEFTEIVADKQVGQEAESFELVVKAEISALVFKESDVLSASLEAIDLIIDENKKIKEANLDGISYKIKSSDLASGQVIFEVIIDKEVVEDIDREELKSQLSGKSEAEAAEYLSTLDGVSKGQLNLWPFWVRRVPGNSDKIELTIE